MPSTTPPNYIVSNYETQGKKDRIKYLRMVSYNFKKGDVIKEGNVLRLLPAGATTASATAHIGINEFINSKKKFTQNLGLQETSNRV